MRFTRLQPTEFDECSTDNFPVIMTYLKNNSFTCRWLYLKLMVVVHRGVGRGDILKHI